MMTIKAFALSLAALVLAAAVTVQAASRPVGTAAGFSFGDWQVTTSDFLFDWMSGNFNAPSHITLVRPGSSVQADRATGNEKSKNALLTGDVVLHDSSGMISSVASGSNPPHTPATLTCAQLQIDGISKTYVATGSVRFTQGGSSASADRAVLHGDTHLIELHGHVRLTQ